MGERVGVLLTAFGGPESLEAVEPFMARLMGREPAPAVVTAAQDKYRAIGGASPLPGTAAQIASALEHHLIARGYDVIVRAGMRYWEPSIPSALAELRDEGAARVVMASLSAFESQVTCEAYRAEALSAADGLALASVCEAPELHRAHQYRDFFGHACAHALAAITAEHPLVVMTAHSLPVADCAEDDPYTGGLREVADAVAAIAGLAEGVDFRADERLPGVAAFGSLEHPVPWLLAYQSRGVRPGAWLEPDLGSVMELAAKSGHDAVVLVPIGFAIDHMETLWDLDIDAAERAAKLGLRFVRTAVPNADDGLIEALAVSLEPLL